MVVPEEFFKEFFSYQNVIRNSSILNKVCLEITNQTRENNLHPVGPSGSAHSASRYKQNNGGPARILPGSIGHEQCFSLLPDRREKLLYLPPNCSAH